MANAEAYCQLGCVNFTGLFRINSYHNDHLPPTIKEAMNKIETKSALGIEYQA